ncbi:MAG: RimK family alpha-L-glutamate ligase [Candidatus Delongbacteria bacterium]|nr:RimK family alpha-L-glutamate ligase [Candidatus Delongbacteria bacterium]MBN2836248.1 RimK family alpha-L-glutamate ligase [Candidatus Delongbacteria bacterium]
MKFGILTSTITEDSHLPNILELESIMSKRGHNVCLLKNGEFNLEISSKGSELFYNGKHFDIRDYDMVFNRFSVRDKSNADYYIMEEFIFAGVDFFNKPEGIVKARNKLLTLQILGNMGIDITKSYVIRRFEDLKIVKERYRFPMIVKNIFGSLGSSTLLVYDYKQLKSIFDYLWNVNRNDVLLIQEFITSDDNTISDYRVFVAGDKVLSSMKRTNETDDFRSNFKRGAGVKYCELNDYETKMCIEIASKFDLDIAGIDFMRTERGPVVLEVNSNPGMEGIRTASLNAGFDILEKLADYFEERFKNKEVL